MADSINAYSGVNPPQPIQDHTTARSNVTRAEATSVPTSNESTVQISAQARLQLDREQGLSTEATAHAEPEVQVSVSSTASAGSNTPTAPLDATATPPGNASGSLGQLLDVYA